MIVAPNLSTNTVALAGALALSLMLCAGPSLAQLSEVGDQSNEIPGNDG